MMDLNKLNAELDNITTVKEYNVACKLLRARLDIIREDAKSGLTKGTRVSFICKNRRYRGMKILGVVEKVNPKKVRVTADDGQTWIVSPTMLNLEK